MAKYLHIEIPKPCSEEWNAMQDHASGKFCGSYRKTVIDFSEMSDAQLLNFFKKKNDHVCGRFYADQLERDIPLPVKKIPWLKYFFQVSLPALMFSYRAGAQDVLKKTMAAMEFVEKKQQLLELAGAITVSGCINNFEGKPVPGATIMVQGTGKGTAADSNGIFTIQLTEKERLLEVTSVGYEKKLVAVTSTRADVQLTIATGGAVVILSDVTSRRRMGSISGMVMQNIWGNKEVKNASLQKSVAIELFPNPVKRNGVLTVHWKSPVSNDQQITLYNSAGIMLLKKTIIVDRSLSQQQLTFDLHAAGYYFLHVIDTKTNNKQVIPVVIE